MDNLIIATQTGGILKPFAWILGKILEVLYDGFAFFGIYNIGLLIIVFTFVVRMLMLPMTIKQQKFTKMNSVMTPEIQAIQKKYKDKKDQQSQLAMQEEMKAVYDKYGTSPTGSCLQLIIQMPILFTLYRVIMNIPAYVQPIKELYASVITSLNASQMSQFFGINTAGSKLKASQITQCIDALTGYSSRTKGAINLAKGVDASNVLSASSNTSAVDKINSLNSFFGLNLGISPSAMFKAGTVTLIVALIIPILAGIFQLLSVQLSQKINGVASTQDNPMAGSMKAMNIMMPLFSVYMCWILSAGIGLYWMAGSLIMMLQQVIINLYLGKMDVNDIIEANREKAAEKAEKRKAKQGIYREQVLQASKTNTRSVQSSSNMTAAEKEEKIRKSKENAKAGSLAAKANMVSDYNKKHSK